MERWSARIDIQVWNSGEHSKLEVHMGMLRVWKVNVTLVEMSLFMRTVRNWKRGKPRDKA